MDLLLKIPGRRQAGSHYFCSSEFEEGRYARPLGHCSVVLFRSSWLNSLMWKGCKQELKHEDLYATPEESLSQVLHKRFSKLVAGIDNIILYYTDDSSYPVFLLLLTLLLLRAAWLQVMFELPGTSVGPCRCLFCRFKFFK